MKRYSAVMVCDGTLRRLTFEALDENEARAIARKWDVGFEGEAPENPTTKPVEPEAFNLDDTRKLLGGVSRATVYRWCWEGRLQRVPNTGRLLITRKSITQLAAGNN